MAAMQDSDPFTVITATPEASNNVYGDYERHSSAKRNSTTLVLSAAIRAHHPDLTLTVVPTGGCSLIRFAQAGHAQARLDTSHHGYSFLRSYYGPPDQFRGAQGALVDEVIFAKYDYYWDEHEFVVYVATGVDDNWPSNNQFVLHKPEGAETVHSHSNSTDRLIVAASTWALEIHDEILVFDRGFWQKSHKLWEAVQEASWSNVILNEDMKDAIVDDCKGFYDNREIYKKYRIPWKRGIIFHGPPGNGKTISIKALMHSLSKHDKPVPTLYVKSFESYGGPQSAINAIFEKARATAPCLLILEDVDSLVTEYVRSYFLNEVDGLESNEGILILASTNHLEKLDPGIAKRPSRFDRKYLFPLPSMAERVQYCAYWRTKLKDNHDIKFPKRLCTAIAKITDKFSFAYLQELFVATLLILARDSGSDKYDKGDDDDDDDLDALPLWREIKRQVAILREGMDDDAQGDDVRTGSE